MPRALEPLTVPESFSALLREYRLLAGLTQEDLASRAGLSPRTISDLERGVHAAPFRHTVYVIARALDLTPEQTASMEASIVRLRGARLAVVAPDMPLVVQLPVPLTPIIGREREIDLCTNLLVRDKVRLLTLTGIGGVGKSRLVLEIAHRLTRSPRNVTVVSLDEVDDELDLLPAIASGLGVYIDENASARDLIAFRLLGESVIIILENFQHVLGARLELLDLLERSTGLQVLVTSRGPLRIRGEHTLLVEPLALPPGGGALSEVEASPAVRMFDIVARMRDPNFVLTAENAGLVAEIVTRLDGLPLAIELAAAQASVLSPREILANLDTGPGLLGRKPPDLSAGQQSIRDAILWSYALLTAPQQRLLRCCSVFPGAWAADHLVPLEISGGSESLPGALDMLGPLVRCGFIQRIEGEAGASRFRMLRLVKEYMQDELRANGEWEEAHEHFAAMMAHVVQKETLTLHPLGATNLGHALDIEEDNLKALLEWQGATGRRADGLSLLWDTRWWLLQRSRRWSEDWLRAAVEVLAGESAAGALTASLLAVNLLAHAQFEAGHRVLRQAMELLQNYELSHEADEVVQIVAWAPGLSADLAAVADAQVERLRRSGDAARLGHALACRASRRTRSGDYAGGEADCLEAIALDAWLLPHADPRLLLAGNYLFSRRWAEAATLLRSTLASLPDSSSPPAPFMFALMGVASQQLADVAQAARYYLRALRAGRAHGSTQPFGLCIEGAAWLASRQGNWVDAACLLGAASRPDLPLTIRHLLHQTSNLVASIKDQLADTDYDAAFRAGRALPMEQALALATKYLEAAAGSGS